MLRDNNGQGMTEYIIIIVCVVLAAPAIVAILRAVRNRGNAAANSIETLDLDY